MHGRAKYGNIAYGLFTLLKYVLLYEISSRSWRPLRGRVYVPCTPNLKDELWTLEGKQGHKGVIDKCVTPMARAVEEIAVGISGTRVDGMLQQSVHLKRREEKTEERKKARGLVRGVHGG